MKTAILLLALAAVVLAQQRPPAGGGVPPEGRPEVPPSYPTRPEATRPTHPAPTGSRPTRPEGSLPTHPAPTGSRPTRPESSRPTPPEGSRPTRPAPTGSRPTRPESSRPTPPEGSRPTRPTPTGSRPTHPEGSRPTPPEGSRPTRPAPTGSRPTRPESSRPTPPEGSRPTRPAPTGSRPTRPESSRPTPPEGSRPTRPAPTGSRPTRPEGSRPTRPAPTGSRPTRPEGSRPTRPAPTGSRPTRPEGSRPTRPAPTGSRPTRPEGSRPTPPEGSRPTRPAPTRSRPTRPESSRPTPPEGSRPTRPAPTGSRPTRPESSRPTPPEGSRPTRPAPTGSRPTRPEDSRPTPPEGSRPTRPAPTGSRPTRPEGSRPTRPAPTGSRPTRPEGSRPTRPAPTESRPTRPEGSRPTRPAPTGSRPTRPEGSRPTRPEGSRPTRPVPTGSRPTRPEGSRPTRPEGSRPTRPVPTGSRPTRPEGSRPTRPEGSRPTRPVPTGSRPTHPDGRPTGPPPLNASNNPASMCGTRDRQCAEQSSICLMRRVDHDSTIHECQPRQEEGQQCRRQEITPGNNNARRLLDDREVSFERMDRERAEGARTRDTATTINGALERPPCSEGLSCVQDTCSRSSSFEVPQCRREPQNERERQQPENGREPRQADERENGRQGPQLDCFCAQPETGNAVEDSRRQVENRDDYPDCRQSFRSCTQMQDDRRVTVEHGESVPRHQNDMCMSCRCENGEFQCSRPENDNEECRRSDPENTEHQSCEVDGRTIQHNEQREDGKCNRCGCRNGRLQCTRIPECREERDPERDDREDTESEREDRECEECGNERASPVCSVRDGRTFPTRCHALRCQRVNPEHLEEGACASRDACSREESCEDGTQCMPLGTRTKMSSEDDHPENRRLCVNRMELRCLPTRTELDGSRRIADDGSRDPIELLEADMNRTRNSTVDDDDRTVCASDGHTYPSTCHMIAESRADTIPHVMSPGRCSSSTEEPRMVCGTDGVSYPSEANMQTRGGNIRRDYDGRCEHSQNEFDRTPNSHCEMARENKRCPDLSNCTRRVQPSDGCCPVCGSIVLMAMDQEALDEHVRTTDDFDNIDDFMGRLFRNGTQGMKPLIHPNTTHRCDVSMTRPTTIPGNNTEVMFRARNMSRDAKFCHQQALTLTERLNSKDEAVSTVESLVAAATAAPESQVDETQPFNGSAVTAIASTVVMIGGILATLAF